MYVQQYMTLLQNVETKEDLIDIAEKIASGEIQYAFPYQLKQFIIAYSKIMLQQLSKNVTSK